MASQDNDKPFVSLCTPTFNRRPFFSNLIRSIENQTYPVSRMEWIIIDDGTDSIEDLVKDIPYVKYYRYEEKMKLGEKRNVMHTKATGDFIVYIDDDDYYPPERVSHAIETLQKNPQAMCAGSSIMHIYFKHIQEMWQFGPYGPNHATAATFAFRKELLNDTCYDDFACLGEEKAFLKEYTVPFVQLDTFKTILVFSHTQNSFDKRDLLNNPNEKFAKKCDVKVSDFVTDKDVLQFFMNDIDDILTEYKPGDPSNKKDVEFFMKVTKKVRDEMFAAMKKQHQDMQNQANQQFGQLHTQHQHNVKELVDKNKELTEELKTTKETTTYIKDKIKALLVELVDCKSELKRMKLGVEEKLDSEA
jgi:glycosyltransferase involved in cell wall biosynthesis